MPENGRRRPAASASGRRAKAATLAITNTVENIALSKAAIEAKEEHDRKADTATIGARATPTRAPRTSGSRMRRADRDPDVEHTGARVVVHVIADGSTLDGGPPGHSEARRSTRRTSATSPRGPAPWSVHSTSRS
ncbi:MAG: hypothetical protein QM658_17615 [Gordonia sp. (in: high G+C Gram-positive bacteria)]